MSPDVRSAPIFVLSTVRAGSTLLRYLLDTHDEIAAPGELTLGRMSYWLLVMLARLRPSPEPASHGSYRIEIQQEARAHLDAIMGNFLRRTKKSIWCEKSPDNVKYVDAIFELFPDARYICLYRSCLDTAHSCIDSSKLGFMLELQAYVQRHPGDFVRAMIENWVDKTERILSFELQHQESCVRVRYEDLVESPTTEMTRVARFLGIPWSDGLVERALTTGHWQGGGDYKIRGETAVHQRSVGHGRALSVRHIPHDLIASANRLLASLDYEELSTVACGD